MQVGDVIYRAWAYRPGDRDEVRVMLVRYTVLKAPRYNEAGEYRNEWAALTPEGIVWTEYQSFEVIDGCLFSIPGWEWHRGVDASDKEFISRLIEAGMAHVTYDIV